MTKPRPPRMTDIAREANVNRITVSRALSRPELVASDTLERIRKVIAKTGYVPNQIARGMKSEHSRIVTLVTPPQMSGVYGAILQALSAELYKSGFIVNLFPVHDLEGQQEVVLRELVGWRPAAIVIFGVSLTPDSIATLNNAHVPLIELLNFTDDRPGTCVGYDQRAAARLLTRHLLDRGYGKICYVHWARRGSIMNELRLAGFADAVTEQGGTLRLRSEDDEDLSGLPSGGRSGKQISGIELKSSPTFHAGYELMASLCERGSLPDALLFASDMVAVGALQYCVSHGLRLCKDVALCAFDGIELTSVMKPQLTCLDFPYERVIAEGAKQILLRAKDQARGGDHIKIPVKLLHRDST